MRFLVLILIFLTIIPRSHAKDFNLKHAVGLYITPKGQKYFNSNLENLFKRNGLNLSSIDIPKINAETEEAYLEDMIPAEDVELREMVMSAKDFLKKFFRGFELGKNKFAVEIKDIKFRAKWDRLGVYAFAPFNENVPQIGEDYSAFFSIELQAQNINFSLDSFSAQDINHPFLGKTVIENYVTKINSKSEPLIVKIPAICKKDAHGKLVIKVLAPSTNLEQLIVDARIKGAILLPKIEIRINDHVVTMNMENIERAIRDSHDLLLTPLQEAAKKYLVEEVPEKINLFLQNNFSRGFMNESPMDPPGAPKPGSVKFKWGLDISDINFKAQHLHLMLDGYVNDPTTGPIPLPNGYQSLKAPKLNAAEVSKHDMVFSLNQGFLNKVLQLSTRRGYFSQIKLNADTSIVLTKQPVLEIKERARLKLQIEYKVSGIGSWLVKNPILIDFDLFVEFPIKNGKPQMVAVGVDRKSIWVPDHYIRLFPRKVRKVVRNKLMAMEPAIKGYVLAKSLPIPSEIASIPLKMASSAIDSHGHLLFFLDYDFNWGNTLSAKKPFRFFQFQQK